MSERLELDRALSPWRQRLFQVIFGIDTPAGRRFDIVLIAAIIVSVIAVMFDSVDAVRLRYGAVLYATEWLFTLLFSTEYVLRLLSLRSPWRYVRSFFGLVDLLSILPTYLSLLVPGANYLLVIRVLRILRIFRVFKLFRYLGEANYLIEALRASRRKVIVFLFTVLTSVVVFGSIMYLVEGVDNGFTSIPRSVYWAIVTLTTVGYGDISPHTAFGQGIAAVVMILGYAILAVPTGIYAAELGQAMRGGRLEGRRVCAACGERRHDREAQFCRMCGAPLPPSEDRE